MSYDGCCVKFNDWMVVGTTATHQFSCGCFMEVTIGHVSYSLHYFRYHSGGE